MTAFSAARAVAAAVALAAFPLAANAANGNTGARLYTISCSSCHGADGQGSNLAPSLVGQSADAIRFMLDTGRMPASAPNANGIHRTPRFSQPEIDAIVAYVLSFNPAPVDTSLPRVYAGNPVRGRALFAEHCAVCHDASGAGGSVGYGNVAPALTNATVFEVAEAIRAGPGVMPRFGPDVLSDRDVSDIAYFVNDLQTHGSQPGQINAGGIPLGRVGPVPEGLIAWIVGLGLLVLFVRAIGTTQ
ncbi:MAG TPA: c-type cytochrome [Candidatus Acidoferrales bacterium]|nr:c-type cytochrome [Candidatus Acidoferrales bacterium]